MQEQVVGARMNKPGVNTVAIVRVVATEAAVVEAVRVVEVAVEAAVDERLGGVETMQDAGRGSSDADLMPYKQRL